MTPLALTLLSPRPTVPIVPASFSGLAAHWKADSFSLADGTGVGGAGNEWIDQVGNANHHGRNSDPTFQPLFKTNIQNGKPGILFTWTTGSFATQHFLDLSNGSDANSIVPAGDYTVMAVTQPSNISTTAGGTLIGNAYTANYALYLPPGTTDTTFHIYDSVGTPADIASNTYSNQLNVTGAYFWIRSGGKIYFRLNNTDQGGGSNVNAGRFNYFANVAVGGVQRYGGYIFEVCIYTAARSGAECDSLYNSYLKPKWGLP